MRKLLLAPLATLLIFSPISAQASLNGVEDYSESRIVALSHEREVGANPWVNGSGYLYSPRIVFTAAHFKDHGGFEPMFISPLNQKVHSGMETVKVVKVIVPSNYENKYYSNDFAIMILEKPIAEVPSAPLVTPEILAEAIRRKIPMKITGYGAYLDVCEAMKVPAPCTFGNDRTSLVPRSIEMLPWSAAEIQSKFNQFENQIADHLFLTSEYKGGPCGGDSGGPTTVVVNELKYYVGTVPSGFWNAYSCGQSPGFVSQTLGYTAPVYKFQALISEAEKYVLENPYRPEVAQPASSPIPSESATPKNMVYILEIAKKWALSSRKVDTAYKQCSSARDKGLIFKNGKTSSLGVNSVSLRSDLKTTLGFKYCLTGFQGK